jgi:hypothetical protein
VVELTRRRAVALLLALALAAPLAICQDAAQGTLAPRRLLLAAAQKPGFGLSAEDLALASRSMLLALQEARPDLVLVEPARQPASFVDDEMTILAGESGADCWLLVEFSGTREQPSLRVRSFDILSSEALIDKTTRRREGGSFTTTGLALERWEDLSALLAGSYPPRAAAAVQDGEPRASAGLTVRALPGSVVTVVRGGRGRATIGEDGAARLEVPALPAVVEVRATKRGFLPARRILYIRADRDVSIEQKPAPRLAIDASMLMAWPGAAVLWSPVPELLFVRGGLTTYLLGLVMRGDAFITTDPFTNLDLLAGVYLNPADSALRLYVGAGGFLRLVHAPALLLGIDPLAPFGIEAVLGAEMSICPSAKVFAEFEPMLYVTGYPGLLLSTQGSSRGWFAFTGAALQVNSFRVGLRWPR